MVKIKLAVVRNNGAILKRGVFGAAEDAANRAANARKFATDKGVDFNLTCEFEEFDITAINFSGINTSVWSERYELNLTKNNQTQERYWRIIKSNGIPMYSGLNNPNFTEEKAHECFENLLKDRICKPGIKIYFLQFTDGTKLREIA